MNWFSCMLVMFVNIVMFTLRVCEKQFTDVPEPPMPPLANALLSALVAAKTSSFPIPLIVHAPVPLFREVRESWPLYIQPWVDWDATGPAVALRTEVPAI